jgi:ribosomal protein S18 acetylase RimI-like enzyme
MATSIIKASVEDALLLIDLGKQTFLQSHGHSASKNEIDFYISHTYTKEVFDKELSDPANHYYIIYQENLPAGFSKIIFNTPHGEISEKQIAKLERIYILERFYSQKIGSELFDFNLRLAKEEKQKGMWLFVWKENLRAFHFYRKQGFEIVGSHDYRISATHSNPNHIMFLNFNKIDNQN